MTRKQLYGILLLLLSLTAPLAAQPVQSISRSVAPPHEPGFLYVRFKHSSKLTVFNTKLGSTGFTDLDNTLREIGAYSLEPFAPVDRKDGNIVRFGFDRLVDIKYTMPEGITEDDAIRLLSSLPEVELVSRRMFFKPCFVPNDPLFSTQYGLQTDKMNLVQAWDISKGDTSVVMADLDEGVNYNHEDLKTNLELNEGEMGLDSKGHDKRTNGIDDDGDGYVDNWHGWDFSGPNDSIPDNDPMPGPGESHGTCVGGILAATPNNGLGVAGVGYMCRYLPLKCTADSGANAGDISQGYNAIYYAATHGARVANCSWGGSGDGFTSGEVAFLQSLIDFANANNMLVVVASGNSGYNIDDSLFYPASLNKVLVVGASDGNDDVLGFSDYGHHVDVFAPGVGLATTDFPGDNAYNPVFGGTSGATPNTVGVAALVCSLHPDWPPLLVKRQIVETVDPLASPTDRNLYWGRVNAYKALKATPTFPFLVISDYNIDGVEKGGLDFLNKEYTLDVTFKNVAGAGTLLSVRLLPPPDGFSGYDVLQGMAQLGSVDGNTTTNGIFKFTRDSTINGAGTPLPLWFFTTDGKTYSDTLLLNLNINGDSVYVLNAVSLTSSIVPSLTISPNPAQAEATAYFTLASESRETIVLTDMLGRTVRTFNAGVFGEGANRYSIPLDGLSAGVYFIRLEGESGSPLFARVIVK